MTSTVWTQVSEEQAHASEEAGQSVVALQGTAGHVVSGVIWRQGLVVTANHSVKQDEVTVILPGAQTTPGQVKGRDPSTDLAIIKMESDQQPAVVGDAGQLRVGHLVLALARTRRGNLTASSGIVSGLMGSWQTWQGGQIDRFIRPDLTLYRGYSGGPLINPNAEVLGINTAELRRGTPITIPTITVTRVVDELLAKGHIARPFLGAAVQPVRLPFDLATKLKIEGPYGLLVAHLEEDGPASSGGLMLGDIIIEVAHKPIGEYPRIHGLLANHRVGDSLPLAVVRAGSQREISVTLGDRFGK